MHPNSPPRSLRRLWVLFSALLTPALAAGPAPGAPPLWIRHATVVSPERPAPLVDVTVIVEDGKIRWVGTGAPPGPPPAGVEILDATGKFLVPGLIDSHVHAGHTLGFPEARPDLVAAYHAQVPRSYLYFGFTSLVDPDLKTAARERFTTQPVAPALYSCGRGIRYFGGYGPAFYPEAKRYEAFPVWIFDEAQATTLPPGTDRAAHTPEAIVAAATAAGARCIKTYHEPGFGGIFDWPVPSPELLRQLVAAAHAHRVPVLLHATGLESFEAGLAAGVDVFAHGLWHWPGSRLDAVPPAAVRQVVGELARRQVAVQPTARVIFGELDTFHWSLLDHPRLADALPPGIVTWLASEEGHAAQRDLIAGLDQLNPDPAIAPIRYLDTAKERVRAMLALYRDAGVRLIFGSDTPTVEGIGNPPGLNGYLEIQAWAAAGISPTTIFLALTLENARALGLADEIGTVEVGKRADLLVLDQDPRRTADAYDTITWVVASGRALRREALSARP